MGKLTIDLTNYKDRVGSRVPEGRYRVQVEDVEETKANSGNTMINIFLRITGGEFDGQNLMDRLVLTEKSLFRVVGFLQAIGIPTPRKRLSVDPARWIGKVLEVDVEDGEPYNGRIRSEVRGYNKVTKAESAGDDIEDVTDEPTDYDEDVEPEKAKAAEEKRAKKNAAPEPDESSSDEDVELDEVEL